MEKDELCVIKLRDCFTGGYTLPQYCLDNGIKRPLFVTEEKFLHFAWEVHIQFHYDKRMTAQFSVLDIPTGRKKYAVHSIAWWLSYTNFSEINPADFDAIIFLTGKKIEVEGNVIFLSKLTEQFTNKTYLEIPLLHFLQRYPKVKLILTKHISIRNYSDGLSFNKTLKSHKAIIGRLKKNPGKNIKTPLDKFGYTNEEVLQILDAPEVITNPDGTTLQKDTDENSLQRIQNGKRVTAYQPEHFQNKIYFFGSCHDYGIDAPFDKTVESYLQKMLNEKNLPYRVENESQRYFTRCQDIFYNLNRISPAPGDIIFFWYNHMPINCFPLLDLSDAFAQPHDYKEIFCVKSHVNELGYKILAEKYFEYLTENNFFRDKDFTYPAPPPAYHRFGIPPQFEAGEKNFVVNEDLEAYKKFLRAKKIPIGALVMNCNPFTLGHQYLVEYAASKVAKLYLFVVEEDRSEFPFADRIELVRQGVKNFSNVEVLPSGKFIISQQTFSGYFNKAELQDVAVDSSEDVEIFAKEIAPTLGITIRFAGEEPTDNVTRQYNETMKKILPRHGVEFCEIPRKNFGEEPISASKVRAALKVGDFDKIKNLVPETTYLYLRGRYSVK